MRHEPQHQALCNFRDNLAHSTTTKKILYDFPKKIKTLNRDTFTRWTDHRASFKEILCFDQNCNKIFISSIFISSSFAYFKSIYITFSFAGFKSIFWQRRHLVGFTTRITYLWHQKVKGSASISTLNLKIHHNSRPWAKSLMLHLISCCCFVFVF